MTTPFKTTTPTADQMAARIAVIDAMRSFGDRLTPPEQLAVAAYLVGQLIAVQDQTRVTPVMALDLVQANIEAGNRCSIDAMRHDPSSF